METFAWSKALRNPAKEFILTKLKVLEGEVPKSIRGALYRNGPAKFERGDQYATHWFDGDGAVLGVWFGEDGPSAMYKFVETEQFIEEEKAGEFLYRRYNYKFPGLCSQIFGKRKAKNASNTSVLPLKDKLLTLWEGGWPYSLDLDTLKVKGIENLGFLEQNQSFSAHPKVDGTNGDIYNFGFSFGMKLQLLVYRTDKDGKLIARNGIKFDRPNQVHDCVLAGDYLIIFNYATKMSLPKFILGLSSFHESLEWKPELGTEIFIINKKDLSLASKIHINDAFYIFHFTNGCQEEDGNIGIEFVKYDDYTGIDIFFANVPGAARDPSLMKDKTMSGKTNYMKIDPKKGKVLEFKEVNSVMCEFPTVADSKVGLPWRYTYFSCHSDDYDHNGEMFKAIGRHDRKTNKVSTYYFGPNRYVNEPILVSDEEGDDENGHLLTLVYDAKEHSSEIWVHRSDALEKGPVCRLGLPGVVPFGFHGRWQEKSQRI